MPKKKQSPTAFNLFVSDWKKEHEEEFTDRSAAEMLKECRDIWKNCPEKQNYYQRLAVQVKGKAKLNVEFKYTSTGEAYQSKEAERKEVQDYHDNMILEIKTTINDLSALCIEALVNHRFYFIHANYYVEWTTEHKFIPCEVAIVEYSLFEGILDVLHFFPGVDTPDGKLPLGYAFEAKNKAEISHEIPPPPFEPAEDDFHELSSRVLNFLTKNGATAIPPVYTMNDNMNCNYSRSTVCDFMELVLDFSGKVIRVYQLQLLVVELIKACSAFNGGTQEPISDTDCEQELSIDPFLYVQGIACDFHILLESDAHRFCSKSTVQRWAYSVSKYCCRKVGIEPSPGKHCPFESSEETVTARKGVFRRDAKGDSKGRKLSSPKKSHIGDDHDEPVFQRPKPDSASAPIYKFGWQADSEILPDEASKYVKGTGVRLPKTRGKADLLIFRQKNTDVRGFTKDEFPALGKAKSNSVPWKTEEPRPLTADDFPSLGGPSRRCGKK